MCDIVGFIGSKDAKEVGLSGLVKLEYCGYDSYGMSLFNTLYKVFDIYEDEGRVQRLIDSSKDALKITYRDWPYQIGNPWQSDQA